MTQASILVATIGRPHGVRGLVRLHAATDLPETVEALGALHDAQGRLWRVRWRGAGIAEVIGSDGSVVADRDAAAKLVNLELFADRASLPDTDEDEFYHADLIGMAAVSPEGAALGVIATVHDYGAGVSIEITGGKAALLVPFTHACVPEIDLAARRVVVVEPDEIELSGDLQVSGEVPGDAE